MGAAGPSSFPMKFGTLIAYLSERNDLPRYQIARILKSVVRTIRNEVQAGSSITFRGLGTFRAKQRGSRIVQNFQGQRVATRPRRKVSFLPSKSLKKLLT